MLAPAHHDRSAPDSYCSISPARRRAGVTLTLVAIIAIGAATLTPQPPPEFPFEHLCLVCGDLGGVDSVLNVLLFIPLGVGLALAGVRPWRAMLAGAALSIAIELSQLTIVPGRDAAVGDVMTNTLGTLLGAMLVRHAMTLARPSGRAAARLAAGAGLVLALITSGSAWALAPSLPEGEWWAQWRPDHAAYDPYAGELLSFTAAGIALPRADRIPDSRALRVAFAHDSFVVRLGVTPPPAMQPGLLAIARIAHPHAEAAFVGTTGDALLYRSRTRADDAGFRSPLLALPHAVRAAADAAGTREARITAERVDGIVRLEWADATGVASRTVRLGPALGWALVLPRSWPIGPWGTLAGAFWLAALALPLGYWGAFAARGARRPLGATIIIAWTVVAIVAGELLAPLALGMPMASPAELCASMVGVALGAMLGARMRARD
jgi:VanZ family protein